MAPADRVIIKVFGILPGVHPLTMIKFLQTPTAAKKYVLGGLLTIVAVMMVITLIPGIYDGLTGTTGQGVYVRVAGHDVTTVQVDRMANQMAKQQRIPPE